VISLHGADVEYERNISSFKEKIFKNNIHIADVILTNSEFLMNEVKKIFEKFEKENFVVPMGVDVEEILNVKPYIYKKKYIFSAGRFVYDKGFDVLVNAFSRVYDKVDVDLIIAGDGEKFSVLKELVKQLNLTSKVIFTGRLNHQNILNYIAGSDLVVVPSRREAFGILNIEALVLGKPIIATNVGGIPEILENGENIILVNPDSENELTNAIIKILQNKNIYSVNKEKFIKKYSWDIISGKYLGIFKKIVQE
jgi:glycosyltransferase involved in cell wall biosynthesis